jgi:hypothetical protein
MAGRLSRTYLIADARERAVIPFIEEEIREFAFIVKQVTTADYLVCIHRRGSSGPPDIVAALERKTLADFAASFRDGRHRNTEKLLALRSATGCGLYYLVEGPAFPDASMSFGGIPHTNILAAMTRLMVSDGIFVVQTENARGSARRLGDFLRTLDACCAERGCRKPAPRLLAARPEVEGTEGKEDTEDTEPEGRAGRAGLEEELDELGELEVPDILTARAQETDEEAAVCVWSQLHGVSVATGGALVRAFSVAELPTLPLDRIGAVRTSTGRSLSGAALASVMAARAGSTEHAVRLVSGLRGITLHMAAAILEATGGFAGLCAHSPATLAAVRIPQKSRSVQLGAARAGRILRVLTFRVCGLGPGVA